MMLAPLARTLVTLGLCLVLLLLLMTARSVLEARAEQMHADRALAAGDLDAAIIALRRSARWNAPGNVYARDSLATLERLAKAAELRGDAPRALAAQRAVHAAIHASSGLFSAESERLRRADERIAALMASEASQQLPGSAESARAEYFALLQVDRPRAGWVLFAGLGFLTWVTAAAVFLLRGVDDRGRVMRRVARRSGLFLILGWIAFAVGLRLA